jgi:hypothetical protein
MKVNIYDLMENIEDSSVRMEDNSVVSSERIKELTRMKIQNASNKKRSSKKTILTVGIAVAVVAALGATAFAAINGGLANLSFGKSSWGPSIEEDIKNSVPPREFVSSQGYPDSPEYQATKEWIAFDDSYDREFKILDAFDAETKRTGTDPFAEKYGDYGVYSQEMADKMDEIAKEYGLKLHSGGIHPAGSMDEMYKKFGNFSKAADYAGYYFLNANNSTRPGIVDASLNPILDPEEIYSGIFGRVSLNFYAFNSNGNRGIAVSLANVMKCKDGPRLGGHASAAEDFGEFAESDDLLD